MRIDSRACIAALLCSVLSTGRGAGGAGFEPVPHPDRGLYAIWAGRNTPDLPFVQGGQVYVLRRSPDGRGMRLRLNEAFARSLDGKNCLLRVIYLDEGRGRFDTTANRQTFSTRLTGSGRWKTTEFPVEAARFSAGDTGAHISVKVDVPVTLHRVEVVREKSAENNRTTGRVRMNEKRVAPYGSWKSPITSELIASGTIGLGQVKLDGEDIYWVESRPAEQGRNVVVRRTPDGQRADVTTPGFNVRTRVHEYGGGAYVVSDGVLWFSNFDDQRLYRQEVGGKPQVLTPESDLRFADADVDKKRQRLICVREDHREADREAVNTLVAIDTEDGGPGRVLVSGNDFYASPRVSPDGSRLAWLTWNHPNMPWDGCELWVGEFAEDGAIGPTEKIAGGEAESIFQPGWAPDGTLCFVSDRTGWWNLYRWRDGEIAPLVEMEAEFGRPQWVFGLSTYGVESAGRIICAYSQRGTWTLAAIDTASRTIEAIETPYTVLGDIQVTSGRAVFTAASPDTEESVVRLDLVTRRCDVLQRSSTVEFDPGYLSSPQAVEFPTEGGKTAHAFFYPPQNKDCSAPSGKRPPLLVKIHGGPTAARSSGLNLGIQYWTSRGIAVLDVNYGGSTGYGRAYRERLNGQWGVVDVDDCVNGARYLVERGLVDGDRLAIRGGSAGGYTTLCALTFRDVFKAGASYYGVSDLEALTRETHKFESRYLDGLVGPYPEARDLYRERSAIYHTDRLSCPVIFFQGLEDKIVLPNQAEMMVAALRDKKLPVAYVAFEGEQHGFRRAENIKRALDGELYFYSRIFGFDLADPVEPVPIENLK